MSVASEQCAQGVGPNIIYVSNSDMVKSDKKYFSSNTSPEGTVH